MRSCLGCALVLSVFVAGRADACTGVYVGRKASASGATLLCRTVDTPPATRLFRNVVRPRVENAPGRTCTGFHGFSWPLPATTYKYVCTPATESNRFGDFASLGINEKGLAVSATVTGYSCEGIRTADPFVTEGLSEDSMTGLIAASCATAREAIFDDLAWYVTRQNSTCRYSHNYHTHVLTPFKPQRPFEVAAGRLAGFWEK